MKTYADRIARLEAKVRELETDSAIRHGRATDLRAVGARPPAALKTIDEKNKPRGNVSLLVLP